MTTTALVVAVAIVSFTYGAVGTGLAGVIITTLGSMRAKRNLGPIARVNALSAEGWRLTALTVGTVFLWPLVGLVILIARHGSQRLFWNLTRHGKISTTEAA